MIRAFRELERVESRVLGAMRFVDASTRTTITTSLSLRALDGEVVFVRNRSGLWVIDSWSELPAHAAAFREPPPLPAPGTLNLRVSVSDPLGAYVPRRVSVALPRDPAAVDETTSLFHALEVPMYPAASARTGANWSTLRVTVTEDGTGDALGGALILVRRNGAILARGLTDGRGEALVAVVGVPMLTFGQDNEAVVVDEVAVTVQALFDPVTGTRREGEDSPPGTPVPVPDVDPDVLEAASDSLPQATLPLAVAARRSQAVSMAIDLP